MRIFFTKDIFRSFFLSFRKHRSVPVLIQFDAYDNLGTGENLITKMTRTYIEKMSCLAAVRA